MLILLPPSEGKAAPPRGRSLDLGALSQPVLSDARRRVLDALRTASAGPDALTTLKVGLSLAAEVRANLDLDGAPCAPASRIYTGVLFDALSYATLSEAGRRRARESVLIFSAAFGVLRLDDRLPAYRLSGDVALPDIGRLGPFWNPLLTAALEARRDGQLVIDCRSATYQPFWTPSGAWPVRVFREVGGQRSVVSHLAKHARGLLARALCEAPRAPRTPEQAAAAASAWFDTHEVRTAAGVVQRVRIELTPRSLDVITD
ncbi:YaaA family protein [Propioniciclava tarda]|uniref:YaaA family protein n=1 Tax=Propioniciclava tarda TaxID=433330 RepID=UPI0011681ED7|nr:peroxide stress protein YaaA [Propioniciclava tarda]SMO42045.1 hypothetical protein SAMN06266982_102237 [Propioniciclava tarda]